MSNDKNLRYVLYARKSSESEDRQMASIDDQITEVQKIANELGIRVVKIFTESKSAKAPGRPVFNEMLGEIESGNADAILCWKLNRLARNPVDGGRVSWLLQNSTIKHIQCHGRDYKPSDNVLMMQVELGMANQYVKELSVDVKRGMRQKALRGWNPASHLPIGYLHNKEQRRKVNEEEIIPDPERFHIVKKLWDLMLTGSYSLKEIKKNAENLGLKNNNNKPYSIKAFQNMFKTEFYHGFFYWTDENGTEQRFKGKHKTLIDPQQWDKVQLILGNRKRVTRAKKYTYKFRGLLSCGECGGGITAERKFQVRCTSCKHKFSCLHRNECPKCNTLITDMEAPNFIDITYYRCTKKKGPCSQKATTEKEIQQQYQKLLSEVHILPEFHKFFCDVLKASEESELATEMKLMQKLKKQQTLIQQRKENLMLMRADAEINKEEYLKLIEKNNLELQQIQQQSQKLQSTAINWSLIAKKYADFALKTQEILEKTNFSELKSLLSVLGSNQSLKDQKVYILKGNPLFSIADFQKNEWLQKTRFEPKNPLINKGDLSGFAPLRELRCTQLTNVRTAILNTPVEDLIEVEHPFL